MLPIDQYRAAHEAVAFARRDDRAAIVVRGGDRLSWLQGLLTNDVLALRPGRACYAAWLTPQGRMVADLWVVETGEAVLLDVPAVLRPDLAARLDALVFAEDVQVDLSQDGLGRVDLVGPAALETRSEEQGARSEGAQEGGTAVIALPEFGLPVRRFYASPAGIDRLVETWRTHGVPEIAPDVLEAIRIEAGEPKFLVDMTAETIPLEAGLDERAISHTKGCYIGQEIIVRMRDRGHGRVARRLVQVVLPAGESVPAPGTEIFAGGRAAGRITSAARSFRLKAPIALAYLGKDFLDVDGVRVGAPEGPLARVSALPVRRIVVTAAIVERDGAFLLTRRLEGTHLAGCWEFPGGKCEAGEDLAPCLRRELLEELGVEADIGRLILRTTHAYPERTVELHFFATALRGEPTPRQGQEMRWVPRGELRSLQLPEADREIVDALTGNPAPGTLHPEP